MTIDQTEACETLTINITNQSIPTPIDTIIINYGDGSLIDTILFPAYNQIFTHTYSTIGDFSISFKAIKGTSSAVKTQVVHVYDLPDSDFDYEFFGYPGVLDTFYYSNRRYLFTANYNNDTTHQWWVNGVLQNVNNDSIVYNFENAGNQNIKHKITIHGCSDSTNIALPITESEEKIPNIFTPNGDGNNDVFYIQTDGNMQYKFTVVNRHGSRVYVTEGQIISWDGYSYWGELLSPGNYYYILEPDYGEVKRGVIFLSR
jgi:gliding motility-associated-like protein